MITYPDTLHVMYRFPIRDSCLRFFLHFCLFTVEGVDGGDQCVNGKFTCQ